MKKKNDVEQKVPVKTIELLTIIKEEWKDFHNTTDNEEKMNHMIDVMMGIFVYGLSRYDYRNYLKFINEVKEEGQ